MFKISKVFSGSCLPPCTRTVLKCNFFLFLKYFFYTVSSVFILFVYAAYIFFVYLYVTFFNQKKCKTLSPLFWKVKKVTMWFYNHFWLNKYSYKKIKIFFLSKGHSREKSLPIKNMEGKISSYGRSPSRDSLTGKTTTAKARIIENSTRNQLFFLNELFPSGV
jgi:hypothetical protein